MSGRKVRLIDDGLPLTVVNKAAQAEAVGNDAFADIDDEDQGTAVAEVIAGGLGGKRFGEGGSEVGRVGDDALHVEDGGAEVGTTAGRPGEGALRKGPAGKVGDDGSKAGSPAETVGDLARVGNVENDRVHGMTGHLRLRPRPNSKYWPLSRPGVSRNGVMA